MRGPKREAERRGRRKGAKRGLVVYHVRIWVVPVRDTHGRSTVSIIVSKGEPSFSLSPSLSFYP